MELPPPPPHPHTHTHTQDVGQLSNLVFDIFRQIKKLKGKCNSSPKTSNSLM